MSRQAPVRSWCPASLRPGRYRLTVTAEDIAHNIGAQEVQIEIIP